MSGQLPVQIDPIRLADEGTRLNGILPGSNLSRLRELSLPGSRPAAVTVDLQFERTAQGMRLMHGTIRTQVELACGRCLQPVTIEIVVQPLFVLLQPGELESGDAETLVVESPVPLIELAEDELLLAMPMSPGHADDKCGYSFPGAVVSQPVTETRVNPFAELRGLKGKSQD
jgi:uncharacterized protein